MTNDYTLQSYADIPNHTPRVVGETGIHRSDNPNKPREMILLSPFPHVLDSDASRIDWSRNKRMGVDIDFQLFPESSMTNRIM